MFISKLFPTQKFDCPYCKAISAFDCIYRIVGRSSGYFYPVSIWICHNCDRAVFIRDDATQYEHVAKDNFNIKDIYPASEPSVDSNIPQGISSDIVEAVKCYNIGAFKASAVICRRSLQKTCINLGAKKSRLVDQIEELKLSGKLHSDLADIATEIRYLGNDGAHPEDDGLDDIKKDDAKEIIDFAYELLDDLYVRPKKVEAMRLRREGKNNGI